MIKVIILSAMTLFSFGAFAADDASSATNAMSAGAPALTDGQIAKALMTINENEIEAGKVAKSKAQKAEVKDFAKMMIDQHEQNTKDTKSVVKKDKLDTKESGLCKDLKKEGMMAKKELKKSDKSAFDKTYVDAMVEGHQKVLTMIDTTFMPAVQNADLKDQLSKTREAVAMHLDHAKKLQATL